MGLDVSLVNRGRVEGSFNNDIGLGKPFLEVPQAEVNVFGNIAGFVARLAE